MRFFPDALDHLPRWEILEVKVGEYPPALQGSTHSFGEIFIKLTPVELCLVLFVRTPM
jgi:hypothetical protein